MIPQKRYYCRFWGLKRPAWLPVAKAPKGAMLLHHLSRSQPIEVGRYLDQLHGSEDIGEIAAEVFEVVEEDETR